MMIDDMKRIGTLVGILLGAIACGPPRLGSGSSAEASDDATESTTESTTEVATEESESGDPSTSWSTEGPSFVPEWDEFWDCDQWAQDCPEGEKCVPYGSTGGNWDAHKCVPILGDQAPGEPCTYAGTVEATDDCDATSMCWDVMLVDGEPIGVCTPFCMGTPDVPECPPASSCLLSGDSTIALCISDCDPLAQDCSSGLACFWVDGSFACIFTTEDIPIGQPCGFINDCAEGLACLDAGLFPACNGPSCCAAFCDLDLGDAPCEAQLPGTACVPFFAEQDPIPPEHEDIGVCIVPP